MKNVDKKLTLEDVFGILKKKKGTLSNFRNKTWSRFDELKRSQKRGK